MLIGHVQHAHFQNPAGFSLHTSVAQSHTRTDYKYNLVPKYNIYRPYVHIAANSARVQTFTGIGRRTKYYPHSPIEYLDIDDQTEKAQELLNSRPNYDYDHPPI